MYDKSKYEMFFNQNEDLSKVDFSNKESIIERQKKIMEMMNSKKENVYYPLEFINNISYWCIILCHGGYFSAGFFHKDTVVDHKSDHKYVTRKKQGKRQITMNNEKSVKKSIGSQLRIHGERKHQENIKFILEMNVEFLEKSDAIFLQAPGLNKMIFVGEDRSLVSFKKKIINIPYNCYRANYTHMMEIFNKLTSVNLEINDDKIKKILK